MYIIIIRVSIYSVLFSIKHSGFSVEIQSVKKTNGPLGIDEGLVRSTPPDDVLLNLSAALF